MTFPRSAGAGVALRLGAGLGLGLALAALSATTALAHAALLSSSPRNGAVLASAPSRVLLQFDVPVNPRLSTVTLSDGQGREVDGTAIEEEQGVSSNLTVTLPRLQNGVYRLDFLARDDTDLHQTHGAIIFGVGQAVDLPAQPVTSPSPSYVETGTRWLELFGACLMVGVAAVWLGILPAVGQRRPVAAAARTRLLVIATTGYGAIAIGKLGQLAVAAWGLTAGGLEAFVFAVWWVLSTSQFGMLWVAGMAFALLTLVTVRGALSHARSRANGAAMGAATLALLAVASTSSHSDSRAGLDVLQMAVRIVHLGAAGLWVGGLTVLVFLFAGALRGGAPDAPAALAAFRRFTGLAFIAVGLLTASGLLLAARSVASAAALATTPYGLTLVGKMIAGGAALAFGIRHTLLMNPPRGAGVGGPVRVARLVPFEVGVMLVVLWAAAALGATAPATFAGTGLPAAAALEADTTTRIDDLAVHTSLAPGAPGTNSLLVQVRQTSFTANRQVTGVRVTVSEPGQTPQTLAGRAAGGGRFVFPPVHVAAGRLDVAVTIRRSDGTVEGLTCDWTIAPPPPAAPAGLPVTPWAPALNTIALVLALLLAVTLTARTLRARRSAGGGRPPPRPV